MAEKQNDCPGPYNQEVVKPILEIWLLPPLIVPWVQNEWSENLNDFLFEFNDINWNQTREDGLLSAYCV
jgi:hypothetical protein